LFAIFENQISNLTNFMGTVHGVNDPASELRQSQAFLQSILNSTYYGIASYQAIADESGRIVDFLVTFTNSEVPGNFGLTPEDVMGKTCRQVYPGIFDNGIFEKLVHCMETGQTERYEIAVPYRNKEIWLAAAVQKVNDSVTVTSKNITEEKESQIHLESMKKMLEEKNAELERKNKELESFNYIASHDLQEPLRKIQLFYSRILDKEKDNLSALSLDYFSSINSAADRMQHLIEALLSYSTTNFKGMAFEKTDLNELLGDVKSDLEDLIQSKNATIESEELPKVTVISFQFRQLLSNLISNGIKYSKKDVAPIIRISCEEYHGDEPKAKKYWKISVSDNGIGFEQQYEHKIFELFQRLHGKTDFAGTGIGLAICKKIIENHKGFIKVKSQSGQGSVFSVFLPIKN
jgi:signal transduction histidine kinase